jgi:hypothetical protein
MTILLGSFCNIYSLGSLPRRMSDEVKRDNDVDEVDTYHDKKTRVQLARPTGFMRQNLRFRAEGDLFRCTTLRKSSHEKEAYSSPPRLQAERRSELRMFLPLTSR